MNRADSEECKECKYYKRVVDYKGYRAMATISCRHPEKEKIEGNSCHQFEKKKRLLDFFRGKSKESRSVEIDTRYSDLVMTHERQFGHVLELEKQLIEQSEIISRQGQIIEEQDKILTEKAEKVFPVKKRKTIFNKIDLD